MRRQSTERWTAAWGLGLVVAAACSALALAQTPAPATPPAPDDPATQPTLYVVPYAHLDTQWRWDYPTTIDEYLPSTLRENFALFEKYPNYVFNFSGANRYRMMKEYYPEDYATLKKYVAAGRWFPSGSSMEENDVNAPSAESLIRQVLYGKQFFRAEFGRTSAEYMLPDCFGFPASLPSVLAHTGIRGFSTQKLSWNSAMGIPFNVGLWEGLDGQTVVAALNAMDYNGDVRHDLSKSPPPPAPGARRRLTDWPRRIQESGAKSGVFADFQYYGVGDIGGAPREPSVAFMEAIVTKGMASLPAPEPPRGEPAPAAQPEARPMVRVGDGPVRVVQGPAERMFLDISPEKASGLPRYKGDLLLIEHSAGSITSQAYMKRWNRQNELLADAAEKASVAAAWLGARPYPRDRLNRAWTLVMGGQFHDILPGTSLPKAYEYSWNDELLALNQFESVLTSAIAGLVPALDTTAQGTAVLVYNALGIAREDVVEARLPWPQGAAHTVRVVGPDGAEVAAQVVTAGDAAPGAEPSTRTVLFLARVPATGLAVYDVQPGATGPAAAEDSLSVASDSLENRRYRLRLDGHGDIASVFDKQVGRELLRGPIRLALQTHVPHDWPAWNMDWADQQQPPRAFVSGPATIRVVEQGPVRVAVEIARDAEGSRFVQTIRLAAGDAGGRVEIANRIDWKVSAAALKATFTLAASNPLATYNWDIGTIQRGNNHEKQFEVPTHQWLDLTDAGGAFGVTVLTDSKIGSDKPADDTVRLTLLYTPGIGEGNGRHYADQSTQDWGRHEFVYGLAGHGGDWRSGTDWHAQRLNQPLVAFAVPRHAGPLGRQFSLARVSSDRVRVLALKQAEQDDELIVRLVELDGRPQRDVRVRFAAPVVAAREVNGAEEPVGPASLVDGRLATDFASYQPRTFAVRLAPPPAGLAPARWQAVPLDFDRATASAHGAKPLAGFDQQGRALPGELLPRTLPFGGIEFTVNPGADGSPNAVVSRGQSVPLPAGSFTRAYVLAASSDGDRTVTFRAGQTSSTVTVQHWGGFIGQWDNRTWNRREVASEDGGRTETVMEYTGLVPGYVKPAPVGWFASHHHRADGKHAAYDYAYLFVHAIDLPRGATSLTLPDDERVRVVAVTVADETGAVRPLQPLYDALQR